jgi:hypothetical protein
MCAYLHRRGADLRRRTALGMTCTHKAAQQGHVPVLEWLAAQEPRKRAEQRGGLCGGDDAEEEALLSLGESMGIPMQTLSALPAAAATTEDPVFFVSAADAHHKSPLHWAVYGGHELAVDWLLARGANPFARDDEDAYAVHWAAIKGHGAVLDVLCEHLASLSDAAVVALKAVADRDLQRFKQAKAGSGSGSASSSASAGYLEDEEVPSPALARLLGLSCRGLSQLDHLDGTRQDVLGLARDKAKKAKNAAEQKRLDGVVSSVLRWRAQLRQSQRCCGLGGAVRSARSKLWANALVLWCAVVYAVGEYLYLTFVQPHTHTHTGWLPPLLLQGLVFCSVFYWRLAVWGDAGGIVQGCPGDDMLPCQPAVTGAELSAVTLARATQHEAHGTNNSVTINMDSDAEDMSTLLSASAPDTAPMSRSALVAASSHAALRAAYHAYVSADAALPAAPAVCVTCRLERPLRAKHCRSCKTCVYRFDHHCPFINNCVGAGNYRHFILWLLSLAVLALLFICSYILALRLAHPNMTLLAAGMYHAPMTAWVLSCALYIALALTMLRYHIPLVLTGLTTNEMMNQARYKHLKDANGDFHNPFTRGPKNNLKFFFGLAPAQSWAGVLRTFLRDCAKHATLAHYDAPARPLWGGDWAGGDDAHEPAAGADGKGAYASLAGAGAGAGRDAGVVYAKGAPYMDESDSEFA